MNRLRLSLLAAVCVTVLASRSALPAPVPAARSGLEQVPDTAPLVFHLRGVQGTRDRFVKVMEKALPDVLPKFQPQMDAFLKDGFKGHKIRGLAKDGPIFLVFTELPKPGAGGPPSVALIAAVSNYKEFRDNLLTDDERKDIKDKGNGIESAMFEGEPMYFVDRKGYVVVTVNEDAATAFTKKQTGLHTKMSKEQAAKLLSSDLAFYVNMEAVNMAYGDEIKKAKDGIKQNLQPLAALGDESQKKMIELVLKAVDPVFQAVDDMQSVLWTVEFRPDGLALHLESEVREGTPTAQLLKDSRPAAFKDLERMPGGRAYYSALKTSAALYKGLGGLIAGIPLSKDGEESKEIAAALEELAKAGPNERLDSYSFPMAGLQVYQYDDPAKAVAAQLKVIKALIANDPKEIGLKEKPVLKTNAQKHGDFQLHSVQMAWDFEKMAEHAPQKDADSKKQFVEAMKGLLGEKTTLWFGTDGKSMVQVVAADWTTARKLLDRYSKGEGKVGDVKAFQEVRKQMPPRASFLGLIDSVRLFGSIFEIVRPLLPVAQLPPGWPNLPGKDVTSFVGLSATLQPGRGGLDLYLPASAVSEFYKAVVKPLIKE
jgi:hypothetical protein